jgi:RNA polymerase sigma-70 factor (ECF subfamily)
VVVTTVPAAPDPRRVRFEGLVGEVLAPLQRYLRRRVAAEVAEDALADTLLVLWRRLDAVPDAAGEALPWAYAVARRCLANHQRAGHRHLRLVGRLSGQLPAQERVAPPADSSFDGDPDLDAALGALSADDRELLQLWAWEQLEPKEMAMVLGVTPNAVSIRLHRARTKLGRGMERKNLPGGGHSSLGLAEEH